MAQLSLFKLLHLPNLYLLSFLWVLWVSPPSPNSAQSPRFSLSVFPNHSMLLHFWVLLVSTPHFTVLTLLSVMFQILQCNPSQTLLGPVCEHSTPHCAQHSLGPILNISLHTSAQGRLNPMVSATLTYTCSIFSEYYFAMPLIFQYSASSVSSGRYSLIQQCSAYSGTSG